MNSTSPIAKNLLTHPTANAISSTVNDGKSAPSTPKETSTSPTSPIIAPKPIAILCANSPSIYHDLETSHNLDIYTKNRSATLFEGSEPVITHAPCAQWSRLRTFALDKPDEKELAWLCLSHVHKNGGIFEHPAGSSFFRAANIRPTLALDLHYWGFPARKTTWLYFHKCKPISFPLNFNALEKTVPQLHSSKRSDTPHGMALWLINCINQTLN